MTHLGSRLEKSNLRVASAAKYYRKDKNVLKPVAHENVKKAKI